MRLRNNGNTPRGIAWGGRKWWIPGTGPVFRKNDGTLYSVDDDEGKALYERDEVEGPMRLRNSIEIPDDARGYLDTGEARKILGPDVVVGAPAVRADEVEFMSAREFRDRAEELAEREREIAAREADLEVRESRVAAFITPGESGPPA